MIVDRFLLDSDGVITDLHSKVFEFHGLTTYPHYPHDPDTQTEQTPYWLADFFGMSRAELWGPLGLRIGPL